METKQKQASNQGKKSVQQRYQQQWKSYQKQIAKTNKIFSKTKVA